MNTAARPSAPFAPPLVELDWKMSPATIHQITSAIHANPNSISSLRVSGLQRPCLHTVALTANTPTHNNSTGHARSCKKPGSKAKTCANGSGSAPAIHGRLIMKPTPAANHTRPKTMAVRLMRSGSTVRGRHTGCHQPR